MHNGIYILEEGNRYKLWYGVNISSDKYTHIIRTDQVITYSTVELARRIEHDDYDDEIVYDHVANVFYTNTIQGVIYCINSIIYGSNGFRSDFWIVSSERTILYQHVSTWLRKGVDMYDIHDISLRKYFAWVVCVLYCITCIIFPLLTYYTFCR